MRVYVKNRRGDNLFEAACEDYDVKGEWLVLKFPTEERDALARIPETATKIEVDYS
jgi:hypothetical protein